MGWALVTGGSSGMGLEYARQLAARGYDLLLVSNQQAALEQAADDLHDQFGVRTMARYQDLSSVAAADELLAFCVAHSLEIEVLVNNAGMFFFEELHPENEAKALKMLQLHVYTPTRLCILFGEAMKHRGQGYILNVSSMAAKLPCPGIAVYSATKAYLKSFSKSLYFEMRPYGVGVTTVCPAAIQAETQYDEAWREGWVDRHTPVVGSPRVASHVQKTPSGEAWFHELLSASLDRVVAEMVGG